VTFSTALFLLIFGLIRGNPEGWSSALIVGSLVGAVLLLIAFFVVERHSHHAMLDLTLFRNRAFTGVSIVAFALSAGMFAMFLYITLYIQNVLGYSPLEAGVRFIPLTLLAFIVSPIAGKLSARIPARFLLGVGLGLVGVALLLMRGLTPGDDWTALLAGFIVAGIGIGIVNPGIASTAIGVVSAARAGMASGINTTFRQVGIATGVAGLGAVFQAQISSKLTELLPDAPSGLGDVVASGGTQAAVQVAPPDTQAQVADASTSAFVSSMNEILLIGALVCLAGAALGLILVRQSDFVGQPAAQPAAEPVAA
jgi:Na+/melibiose symporter-like transporter